jgi:hypothetical protein
VEKFTSNIVENDNGEKVFSHGMAGKAAKRMNEQSNRESNEK